MALNAGKLDRRIEIQKTTQTPDDLGQPVDSWELFARVWAGREFTGGGETFGAAQVVAEVVARYTIRALAGVVPKMRLVDGADDFNIVAVLPGKERGELLLLVNREDRN